MIEAINLTKRYDDGRLALDAINLSVEPGEIYCLLGANGAGKSTAISIFLSFLEPSSGRALINGIDVANDPLEAKKHVSFVPEDLTVYGQLSARQNIEFFARLAGKRGVKKEECYNVLRQVGLQDRSFEQAVSSFTKGMRQKLGLAIAMMRDTNAVFMDEPTSGLDPKDGTDFMDLVNELRERGKAILIATRDMFRVKDIADRIGILKEGRKIIERTRSELRHENLEALYLSYMGGYREDRSAGIAE